MTTESTSTLGWLDSSEHERRAVTELVSALNEPGTLDELGIGTIRDTFADTLFPGTSTIQTRARYFLFIPWIMLTVEKGSHRGARERARRLQWQLCQALDKAHGPNTGVIGREAGVALQRWPLDIYWLGLARWGIRRHPGSTASYFGSLGRPPSWHVIGRALEEPIEGRRDEAIDGIRGNWASVPAEPSGFPEAAVFALTAEEGRFLSERVALHHPASYLAHILQTRKVGDLNMANYPWDYHTAMQTAPPSVQSWLGDARLFSLVHQGAVILYNQMLAKAHHNEERIESFTSALERWSKVIGGAKTELENWDREGMWQRLNSANPRLHASARTFADRWFNLAATHAGSSIGDRSEARMLIRERELQLKGARARLTHAAARERRRSYPTTARLEFRWTQVRQITIDILAALEQD